MAPELYKTDYVNTFQSMKQVDSWALGVLVYFAIFNDFPFGSSSEASTKLKAVINQQ